MEIKDKVEKIIRSKFKLTDINVKLSSDYIENWDSLSHLALMLKIEKVFSIKLSQKEIVLMTTSNEIIKIIKKKIKKS